MKILAVIFGISVFLFLLPLVSCQSRLIYFPRPYGEDVVAKFRKAPGARVVDYQTQDGAQQAYLFSPSAKPERLWILCGGNGTVALDWFDWVREHAPHQDAWLMIDMPGYGASTGKPNPASIRRSLTVVVPAAEKMLSWQPEEAKGKLRFFGHSLGAAVCLMAAEEYDIHRGVLLTPFTSSMDMAKAMTGMPLGFLVWHRFDNEARLKELLKAGDAEVIIFHGDQDESIPVDMSRRMAKEFPTVVKYHEVPGGHHNTLQATHPDQIATALREARK